MENASPVQVDTVRVSKRTAFLVGAVSGLIMTALLVTLRFAFGTQIITEVLADWLTMLMPSVVFDFLLDRLQFNAKRILFAFILLGQVGVGGGIGMLWVRWVPVRHSELSRLTQAVLLTVALWVLLGAVLTPLWGAGAFGDLLPEGGVTYTLSLLGATGAFALSLSQLHYLVITRGGLGPDAGRREFIRKAAVLSAMVVVGGLAIRTILVNLGRLTPVAGSRRKPGLSTEITPNDEFYIVAKSAVVPALTAESWRLRIEDTGSPYELTYDELVVIPAVDEVVTLTCISNRIGGDLISTARWKGVPVSYFLERAALPEGTERIAFHSADGYFDSFPLEVAMRDNVIVAYEMNGVSLPPSHGFPARIIVPGLYGMENVKWLTSIKPVEPEFRGFWQQRGWADTAVIKTSSRIDVPASGARVSRDGIKIAGVAFAGTRGISKVEVSLDRGDTWRPTVLREPLSPMSWVIWTLPSPGLALGNHNLVVRATDGTGTLQTERPKRNLPDGPDGYHRIGIRVVEPETA